MSNNNDIHKELMEKLDDLTSRLSDIEKDIHHKESPVSADFAEQVTETENDEVLMALENETNATIENIKNSLKRMEEGSYGFCAACGTEIPEERIKALPYTDKCFECASKED
jgi:RNA polymerase-binding transcription factor